MADYVFELPAETADSSTPSSSPAAGTAGGGAVDHTAAALSRLVTQFRKPNMQTFIRALCKPMQPLEQAILDVIASRDIDNAEGESLRMIGRIVKQPPVDVTATAYKSLVRARVQANKSRGLGDDVLRTIRLVLTDYAASVAELGTLRLRAFNHGHASYVIVVDGIDLAWDVAELVADRFLEAISGTGIRARLTFVVAQDAGDDYSRAFRYASVRGGNAGVGGYGSVTTTDVGGPMAAAMR